MKTRLHHLALATVLVSLAVINDSSAQTPIPISDRSAGNLSFSAPNAQIQAFMQVHNNARAAVGVPPLKWSRTLASYAQQWADHLAILPTKLVQLSPHRPNRNGQGENFAGGPNHQYSPTDAAQLWLAERGCYRYGPFDGNGRISHYTQMIWRTTTRVGFGIAHSTDGWTYVVASYGPGGNVLGEVPY